MTIQIFILFTLVLCISIVPSHQTVSMMISQSNNSTIANKTKPTYMTLIEGTNDIYEVCKLICDTNDKKTYYSETTVYPGYGKMFRCQCNEDFTPWYNLNTFTELTMDLLKGDDFFNYYLNMPGNYQNECVCDNLKNLVFNILDSFKDVSLS